MAVKSVLDKNIYSSTLAGTGGSGYGGVTKAKATTGGTYADGIAALTQARAKLPTSAANINITPISAIGGGISGGRKVTDEGVIIGGGAINTTFQPTYGGAIKDGTITGNLGVTKTPSTGKYSDMLALVQANTTPKTAAANTATPTTTTQQTESAAETETETPATYEEYLQQQRELLDKRKTEADRQAELAKERAAVDAQASYAQNMATYGTNAETLAQMGLQGGGYSDYINAQAYAQKRADVQQADVTELAAKVQNNATYEDAISELNKSELEYKEKQQEKAEAEAKEAKEKQDSIYASLWEGATNPNSGYTANNIATIGREYGLSEKQISELQAIVAETSAKYEKEKQAAKYTELVSQIAGATSKDILDTALSNKEITQEQYNALVKTYQEQNYNSYTSDITNGLVDTASVDRAYRNGDITQEQYNALKTKWNNEIDTSDKFFSGTDFESAKAAYNAVVGSDWCTDEVKNALRASYYKAYESEIAKESVAASGFSADKADGKIININSSSYSVKSWGDYSGAGDNDEQDQLARAYVQAAKDGKIAVGQVCKLNYGACWSDEGYYIYIGDGMFVHYKETPGNMQDNSSKYYVPDGFKWSGNGSIKKK